MWSTYREWIKPETYECPYSFIRSTSLRKLQTLMIWDPIMCREALPDNATIYGQCIRYADQTECWRKYRRDGWPDATGYRER